MKIGRNFQNLDLIIIYSTFTFIDSNIFGMDKVIEDVIQQAGNGMVQKHGKELSLMEEVLLMCIRENGDMPSGFIARKCPSIGIAAAILMELVLRNRVIHIHGGDDDEKDIFRVICEDSTTDDILDEAIEIMKNEKNNADVEGWIKCLNGTLIFRSGIKNLQEKIADRLVEKGILKEEEEEMLLGLVIVKKYPFADLESIQILTSQLRVAASNTHYPHGVNKDDDDLSERNNELSERTTCLLGLFYALDKPFRLKTDNVIDINRLIPDKDEREVIRNNLEKLLEGTEEQIVAAAVRNAIVKRIIRVALLGMFNIFLNL